MIPMSEIGWIAGFLEGEGYFTLIGRTGKTPRVEAGQVDICPIDRLYDRFGGRMWQEHRVGTGSDTGVLGRFRGNRQPYWRWYAGPSESIQIMMTIWPLVGTKRREEIEKVLEVWKENRGIGALAVGRDHCKNCGSDLTAEGGVRWISRTDGKGRRKWCTKCGWQVGRP